MLKTFDRMTSDFQSELNMATHQLTTARTLEEIDDASRDLHKVVSGYIRKLKKFVNDNNIRIITDQAKMQKMLQDRFNLDPDKAELTFVASRNLVRWKIRLHGTELYTYVSKIEAPVDLDNFYEWCRCIFS